MSETRLDVREISPAERHKRVTDAFDVIDPGETLTIVNDHEPKPLFYEFQAEREDFDADAYVATREDDATFVAHFPKR